MSLISSFFGGRRNNVFDPRPHQNQLAKSLKFGNDLEAHVFKAGHPGLKEEVKVEIEEGMIIHISSERAKENDENTDTWFLRLFRLPENVELKEVKTAMENGVLIVTVPKVEEKKPEVKSIIDISG